MVATAVRSPVVLAVAAASVAAAIMIPVGTSAALPASPRSLNPCTPAAQGTSPFTSDTNRIGLVDLYFFLARGAPVAFYECISGQPHRLGVRSAPHSDITPFYGAAQWSCGRLTRDFAATATLPDGTFVRGTTDLHTVSCAHRFALKVPASVPAGQRALVRIVDRWRLGGIHARLCTISPLGDRSCETVAFAAAVAAATRSFRPLVRGDWRVELQVRSYRVRATLAVGVRRVHSAAPPTMLATGDSTMGGVDSFLADDLGQRANVVSDVMPGFSISLASGWSSIASAQVRRLRPSVTVVSLGANEGFPMRTGGSQHSCCDAAWVAEYARRVRAIMGIYARHGRGRVIYLTIAAPRVAARALITAAVNAAIVRAADGLAGVRVLRMDLLFSSHGYQPSIRYRGRKVSVRAPDGVHLDVAGTAIEAQQVVNALSGATDNKPADPTRPLALDSASAPWRLPPALDRPRL
jgi:lysophospholipase L1-like esterase